MKNVIFILAIVASTSLFQSCYYDKAELLYPTASGNCDTSAVASYSTKVVPILTTQCYSCHIGASAGGGIVMGNHAADKAIAINGKLYGSITHASGYSAMPKGTAKMNTCDLGIIKKWIDAGSPNN